MNESSEALPSWPQGPAPHLLTEVLTGLSHRQKWLPAKFLYDKRGSEIFEQICELPEYYPTRAERQILTQYGSEIAELVGPDAILIEPGSGSGEKMRLLLRGGLRPRAFVPIEISREILERQTREFGEEFPALQVHPIWGDFTTEVELPASLARLPHRRVIFFPGSTIGNFSKEEAIDFLRRYGKLAGPEGGFLIGADLKKDHARLVEAYDDRAGVTAAFNLNLLTRLNREADASFDVDNFFHRAVYNADLGRVEMHLVSKVPQLVRVNQTVFRFMEGETIHTESSYKYTVEEFAELGAKARLTLKRTWTDPERLFCVYYFERN